MADILPSQFRLRHRQREPEMLHASFQHLDRISNARELALWRRGVCTWEDLETVLHPQLGLFPEATLSALESSRAVLASEDADFFAEVLPRSEHFRVALAFPEETLFLDIETTGLSLVYDQVTLV